MTKCKRVLLTRTSLAWTAALALMIAAGQSFGQQLGAPNGESPYGVVPWTEGTVDDALNQSLSGSTIPMSLYPFASTKDKTLRVITLVGGDPLGPIPTTI